MAGSDESHPPGRSTAERPSECGPARDEIDAQPLRRISIIGCSGGGKSTLARRLGTLLSLPVHHMDQMYWEPGWREALPHVYRARLEEAVAGDRWVIDGTFTKSLDIRLPRTDLVVWLDLGRLTCITRVLRRAAVSYGRVRPDMAPGCPERFDLAFLRHIWGFEQKYNPLIRSALDRHKAWPRTVILKSDRETQRWLDGLALHVTA